MKNHILFPNIISSWTDEDSQRFGNYADRREAYNREDEVYQRDFLEAIAQALASANQIAAYIIKGGAFGYEFRDAIVQVTPRLIHVYRWHEVTKDIIDFRYIRGKIDWQKVMAVMKQDGQTPDENLKNPNPNDYIGRKLVGRMITTYVVLGGDYAWATIHSGSKRLYVHRLHSLMDVLMELAIQYDASSPMM
jgi:hypothetical protein